MASALDAADLWDLWEEHDRMERKIILLERKFTDAELKWLHEGKIPPWWP